MTLDICIYLAAERNKSQTSYSKIGFYESIIEPLDSLSGAFDL